MMKYEKYMLNNNIALKVSEMLSIISEAFFTVYKCPLKPKIKKNISGNYTWSSPEFGILLPLTKAWPEKPLVGSPNDIYLQIKKSQI